MVCKFYFLNVLKILLRYETSKLLTFTFHKNFFNFSFIISKTKFFLTARGIQVVIKNITLELLLLSAL